MRKSIQINKNKYKMGQPFFPCAFRNPLEKLKDGFPAGFSTPAVVSIQVFKYSNV